MSPQVKKVISAVAVAAAGAALVALNNYVVKLPEVYQGIAGSLLAAAVHYINAWGTKEDVTDKILTESK